ncbi:helicase C-terminal domain-containing protein, partial [Escherichia coli]|nr:helicase C-terminal domain-containing protein [Escherichia coli]
LYDAYIAQQNEMSLGGLEKIAADFQEGRTPIIICNKKAEVGINLHRGTTDIHHLTLPWTPASVAQRNGRGARVGSNRASVRVHYYCGK